MKSKVVILSAFAILSVMGGMSQDKPKDQFPKIMSVKPLLSEPIPKGSCKADDARSGWLIISSQTNKAVAAYCAGGCTEKQKPGKAKIGEFVSDSLAKGLTVSLYPQGDGWAFVSYECDPGSEALLEKPGR